MATHYKRLIKPLRVQGLWAWRKVALAMIDAGLPMQTGTVPVERLWAGTLGMFPDQARSVSEAWFSFLADISYLRHTYRHYNRQCLPVWTKGDALLAERLDGWGTLLERVQQSRADGIDFQDSQDALLRMFADCKDVELLRSS